MTAGPDGSLGGIWPPREVFNELARDRRVIPVVRRLLADAETPLSVYRKLAGDEPGTFLLESAETGVWSRYSIIGAAAGAILTGNGDRVTWLGNPPIDVPDGDDPLQVLDRTLALLHTPQLPGLPPFTGGFVGALAYDVIRYWENIPDANPDEIGVPDVMLALATDVAVLDHATGTIVLIANAINHDGTDERVDQAYQDVCRRLEEMTARLARPLASTVAETRPGGQRDADVRQRTSREDYLAAVERGQRAVVDGDVFQVVLSQRFAVDCPVDALEVYRCLRASNPSPYLYLFRGVDAAGDRIDVVGSSPEALVKVEDGHVLSHPIAGTRPRGRKPEEDHELAQDLLADPKERSEHLMLVDLARNDLSRVCDPGTVAVVDFMSVERYSHVMHLVSTVSGQQRHSASAVDVFRSTFPAGTLSGAPKPRAMELIDEVEPVRRGIYGGVVGYFDFAGNMDVAIAIRTAVLKDQVAHVQAGAGIVHESIPDSEDQECHNKAAAVLRAVAMATSLQPITQETGTQEADTHEVLSQAGPA